MWLEGINWSPPYKTTVVSNSSQPTTTDICRSTNLMKARFHPIISLLRFNMLTAQLWRTPSPTISHLSSTSVAVTSSYARLISHSMQGILQVVLANDQIKSGFLDNWRVTDWPEWSTIDPFRAWPRIYSHYFSSGLEIVNSDESGQMPFDISSLITRRLPWPKTYSSASFYGAT